MERKREVSKKRKPRGRASTLEILGSQDRNGKVPAKWAGHHARLTELRDYLTGQRLTRADSAKAEAATSGEHIADAATDAYERDWALALASSDQNVLYEVNQALERMTSGLYGICELTGRPIEAARLKAVPWTRFCAAAQIELEARGTTVRVQLGRRGTLLGTGERNEEDEADEPVLEKQAA